MAGDYDTSQLNMTSLQQVLNAKQNMNSDAEWRLVNEFLTLVMLVDSGPGMPFLPTRGGDAAV